MMGVQITHMIILGQTEVNTNFLPVINYITINNFVHLYYNHLLLGSVGSERS